MLNLFVVVVELFRCLRGLLELRDKCLCKIGRRYEAGAVVKIGLALHCLQGGRAHRRHLRQQYVGAAVERVGAAGTAAHWRVCERGVRVNLDRLVHFHRALLEVLEHAHKLGPVVRAWIRISLVHFVKSYFALVVADRNLVSILVPSDFVESGRAVHHQRGGWDLRIVY